MQQRRDLIEPIVRGDAAARRQSDDGVRIGSRDSLNQLLLPKRKLIGAVETLPFPTRTKANRNDGNIGHFCKPGGLRV